MQKENSTYESYLADIYKWGMFVLIVACVCADVVYTTMKVLGYYPTVNWWQLLLFDCMDALFAFLAYLQVRFSVREGRIPERKLRQGKCFAFVALLVQWNYILYMIPSHVFWSMLGFFCILICFFLDIKLLFSFGASCILSLFISWKVRGYEVYPVALQGRMDDWICCIIIMCLSILGISCFLFL